MQAKGPGLGLATELIFVALDLTNQQPLMDQIKKALEGKIVSISLSSACSTQEDTDTICSLSRDSAWRTASTKRLSSWAR